MNNTQLKKLQELPKFKNHVLSLRANGSLKIQKKFETKIRTQQQFLESSKISNIVKKYGFNLIHQTGIQTIMGDDTPFDNIPEKLSYQEYQEKVLKAEKAFQELPSAIKNKFGQNTGALIAWLNNSDNYDEAVKLGLVPAPEPPPKPANDSTHHLPTTKTTTTTVETTTPTTPPT